MNPGRAFHLQPSEFVWEGGEIAVGDTKPSRQTTGVVKTEIHLDDIQQIQGFIDDVKLDLSSDLRAGDLAFLEIYSGLPIKRVRGAHSTQLWLLSDGRKLLDGTLFKATFEKLEHTTADVKLAGDVAIEAGAKRDVKSSIVHLEPLQSSIEGSIIDLDGSRSKRFSASVTSTSAASAPRLPLNLERRERYMRL